MTIMSSLWRGILPSHLVPQDIPVGAKLSYFSDDTDICTVDNDDSDGGVGTGDYQ